MWTINLTTIWKHKSKKWDTITDSEETDSGPECPAGSYWRPVYPRRGDESLNRLIDTHYTVVHEYSVSGRRFRDLEKAVRLLSCSYMCNYCMQFLQHAARIADISNVLENID